MKFLHSLLFALLSISSMNGWARPIANPVIKGVIYSYDKDYVVLKNGDRKAKVPRKFIPPKTKLIANEYLEIEVTNKELLNIVHGMNVP